MLDRFVSDRRVERVSAKNVEVDRARGDVLASFVRARVFDEDGHTRAEIEAPLASGRADTSTVVFEGGVRVTDASGRTLVTESIRFDSATNRAAADHRVEVRGGNFAVVGEGLRASIDEGIVEISGPVSSRVERVSAASSDR